MVTVFHSSIVVSSINIILVAVVIYKSITLRKNPYKNEIFTDLKCYAESMERA